MLELRFLLSYTTQIRHQLYFEKECEVEKSQNFYIVIYTMKRLLYKYKNVKKISMELQVDSRLFFLW